MCSFQESLTVLLSRCLYHPCRTPSISAVYRPPAGVFHCFFSQYFIARRWRFSPRDGSKLTMRERGLIAWIGPRGIVAAAVASLFALRLETENGSAANCWGRRSSASSCRVLVQSFTARRLALRWKLAEEQPARRDHRRLGSGRG